MRSTFLIYSSRTRREIRKVALTYQQVVRSVGGRSRWRAAEGRGAVVWTATTDCRDLDAAARRPPTRPPRSPASATDTTASRAGHTTRSVADCRTTHLTCAECGDAPAGRVSTPLESKRRRRRPGDPRAAFSDDVPTRTNRRFTHRNRRVGYQRNRSPIR